MSNSTIIAQLCCACRCEVLLRADHDASLRQTGKSFYCLNGHSQSYSVGKSDADKLRDAFAREKARLASALQRAEIAEREARLAKNACAHCRRRFETPEKLRGHMRRVHGTPIKALPADAGESNT